VVGEYRYDGNFILSYFDRSGDWELHNGKTMINSWSDPLRAFQESNKYIECYEKRKSIYKRITKIKESVLINKYKLSEESIDKALKVIVDIEAKLTARTGGLEKIEIVTLNSLYRSFGGTYD
jgi:hypothetical protein